jgi:hypothetical protein
VLVANAQLMPGCDATVIDHTPAGVRVKTVAGEHVVPGNVADLLYVSPR